MNPLVSVAVVTYNHAKFIRQCLDGILMQQTNFDYEVVVSDDCSTDCTADLIREYEERYSPRIRVIYLKKNVGASRNAYEYCSPAARGKYIAVCEGDDVWTDPCKLQKQVDFLEANKSFVLCFHPVNIIDEDGAVISTQKPSPPIFYSQSELFHVRINTLSVVFRKCFDKAPEEIFNVRSGDTYLFGLLATYGKGADLGFVGASYRKHPGGVFSPLPYIEQAKQSIRTRKIMESSKVFAAEYKKELRSEILQRKWKYIKIFLKKRQFSNLVQIALT